MARRLLAGTLMVVVASLVGTGCGRLDLDILTEVFANGRGRMTLHVTASGIFTALAAEAVSEARADGCSPEYYCDAAGAHVIETVSFEYARNRSSLGEETERLLRRVRRPYKDSPSPLQDAPDVTITVDRHVFTTDYHFTQVLSPNPEMQKMDLCDSCEGNGTLPCPLCEGSGRDHCWACLGTGSELSWYAGAYVRCSRCGGTGT
ncbi:MAG: hypothetical protein HPY69_21135, partial [Armatimonadetes bacterium]|nr:hypothetical protein [Armatimonadota bacterium]